MLTIEKSKQKLYLSCIKDRYNVLSKVLKDYHKITEYVSFNQFNINTLEDTSTRITNTTILNDLFQYVIDYAIGLNNTVHKNDIYGKEKIVITKDVKQTNYVINRLKECKGLFYYNKLNDIYVYYLPTRYYSEIAHFIFEAKDFEEYKAINNDLSLLF